MLYFPQQQISLTLSLVLSRAAFKKFEARNCPNIHHSSPLICVQKRLEVFRLIRHFYAKSASNLNQSSFVVCLVYNRRDQ